jgi:hypothetical protein
VLYFFLILTLGLLLIAAGFRYFVTTRVARRLAVSIGHFRDLAMAPTRRRLAPPDNASVRREQAAYDAFARELGALGGTTLGDWEELLPDGSVAGVTRWFIDASYQICGWFAVTVHPRGTAPSTYCISQLEPLGFVTTLRSRANRRLASPATVQSAHCSDQVALRTVLEQHRARIGAKAVRVTSVEDAQAMVDRLRSHVAGWRQNQDPGVLLDQDLRSVLGDHYSRFGPAISRLLRARS